MTDGTRSNRQRRSLAGADGSGAGNDLLRIGERVDVEWLPGQFWRDGVLAGVGSDRATVRLPSGWHVYPSIRCLRPVGARSAAGAA